MFKNKLLAGLLLVFVLLAAQIGAASAAPLAQDEAPITGTIQSITTETDTNGVTTVLVTLLLDDQVTTQTVRLSVDTAVALGLVTLDPETNEPVVDETQVGQPVEIDPTMVIPDEAPTEEEEFTHPIAALLAMFFGEDASVVNGYHEDGFGFGVIAQALWMSKNLNGDASAAGLILEAKQSGDYSSFFPEDTENVPTNWGQFKTELLQKKNNLGVIVSGQADTQTDEQLQDQKGNGHGNDKIKNKNNGKGKGKKDK